MNSSTLGGTTVPPVKFKAFVTKFEDSHKANYFLVKPFEGAGPQVAGAGLNERQVSISLDVPSFGIEEAKENLAKISGLTQMMYPPYVRDTQGRLEKDGWTKWQVSFLNLAYKVEGISTEFKMTPKLEFGSWIMGTLIYPKVYSVTINIQEIPELAPGWSKSESGAAFTGNKKGIANFPYGVSSRIVGGTIPTLATGDSSTAESPSDALRDNDAAPNDRQRQVIK